MNNLNVLKGLAFYIKTKPVMATNLDKILAEIQTYKKAIALKKRHNLPFNDEQAALSSSILIAAKQGHTMSINERLSGFIHPTDIGVLEIDSDTLNEALELLESSLHITSFNLTSDLLPTAQFAISASIKLECIELFNLAVTTLINMGNSNQLSFRSLANIAEQLVSYSGFVSLADSEINALISLLHSLAEHLTDKQEYDNGISLISKLHTALNHAPQ